VPYALALITGAGGQRHFWQINTFSWECVSRVKELRQVMKKQRGGLTRVYHAPRGGLADKRAKLVPRQG